jgi:spermidine synthase
MEVVLSAYRDHGDSTEQTDQLVLGSPRGAIVLSSAAALYVELVMIRWHATCFHAFAIFKNVSLLSCFLGLGVGFALSNRRPVSLGRFLRLLALQTVLFGLLSCTSLGGRIVNPVSEQLVMGKQGAGWSFLHALEGNAFLLIVFVINAFMFVPLGQLAGRLMTRLPHVHAYSLNLLGSLLGIALFFLLSLLWAGPEIWLGLCVLLLVPFLKAETSPAYAGGSLAVMLIALGVLALNKGQTTYSPYQVISFQWPEPTAGRTQPSVRVNHCYYQEILDCSPAGPATAANVRGKLFYGLPYRLQENPGDVLVVGAGTGNDVAAALRHGARSVTAVELDPAILEIGRRVHPEHPYQDPRTRAVVNDARTFIRQSDQSFDTIVYGLLDSHTNMGAMTNVRVDSFVYTVEAFQEAVRCLRSDGLLIVSYTLLDPLQGHKLYAMLREAWPEQPPRAFSIRGGQHDGGTTFVAGPGLKRLPEQIPGVTEQTAEYARPVERWQLATDDWPFFYMQRRVYPFTYLLMIGLMLVVSAWFVRRHLGPASSLAPSAGLFFFLGAGFMLIETKGVTELGLIFGNTWSVVGLVIASILLMSYLANRLVMTLGSVPLLLAFALLLISLLLGWMVASLSLSGVAIPYSRVVLPAVLTLPLFFAGLIFSSALSRAENLGSALSANILGAMLGGFLEYNSMYWGYVSLYPLGLLLYGLAFFCSLPVGRHLVYRLLRAPRINFRKVSLAARLNRGLAPSPAPAAHARLETAYAEPSANDHPRDSGR